MLGVVWCGVVCDAMLPCCHNISGVSPGRGGPQCSVTHRTPPVALPSSHLRHLSTLSTLSSTVNTSQSSKVTQLIILDFLIAAIPYFGRNILGNFGTILSFILLRKASLTQYWPQFESFATIALMILDRAEDDRLL